MLHIISTQSQVVRKPGFLRNLKFSSQEPRCSLPLEQAMFGENGNTPRQGGPSWAPWRFYPWDEWSSQLPGGHFRSWGTHRACSVHFSLLVLCASGNYLQRQKYCRIQSSPGFVLPAGWKHQAGKEKKKSLGLFQLCKLLPEASNCCKKYTQIFRL